ncbi:glycosyltransferase [Patescibacteria group bacterium]|nr:glycosyltransferase [Patescibacteria group bacterium]
MRNTNPLVSVIMPAYNAEKYISEAIKSILNQTFENFKLIIIDDCSTDKTWQIINKYRKIDKRVIAFRNNKNLKLSRTLNRGIRVAKGKYIARMDADDISFPDRLEKQVKFMEANPEVGVSGGTMVITDASGRVTGERSYHTTDEKIRKKIFRYSPFCHPAVIIRKAVLTDSGLYNHYYNPAEDYELYFRIGLQAKFANLKDKLIKYRVVSDSMTVGGLRAMEFKTIKARKKFYDLYQASIWDRIYTFLLFITVVMPIITPNQKLWLFNKIRKFL